MEPDPSRLSKAQELLAERQRLAQQCELTDCLQLGDKSAILLNDPDFPEMFGFPSRSAAKQSMNELQSLRSNLARLVYLVRGKKLLLDTDAGCRGRSWPR